MKSLMRTVRIKSLCQKGAEKDIAELTRNFFSFKASAQRWLTVFA
jgi:hypothetical protein